MNRQITWENLLDLSKSVTNVIVSGCQRTGTTYATEALAEHLGYECYDEESYGVSDFGAFTKLLQKPTKKVVQAPALLHKLKSFEMTSLIVIMTRDEKEVENSMLRTKWFEHNGQKEFSIYSIGAVRTPEDIYRIKLNYSKGLKAVELDYSELRKTHGFVANRTGWGIKQTKN